MPDPTDFMKSISSEQLKLLDSVGDDAVHDAARATMQLLGISLEISAVKAHSVPASHVVDLVCNPEDLAVALYLRVEGDAPGHAAFVCSEERAFQIVDLLLCQPSGETTALDELSTSALMELGNILTSSYLNSLSRHTGLTFMPEPPQLAVDMAYALISTIMVGTVEGSFEAISIVTEFGQNLGPLQGMFLYIPDSTGLWQLINHLKEAA